MTATMTEPTAVELSNGMMLATRTLPNRRVVALEIRVQAGTVTEPSDRRGLAHLVAETLDKGTETRDAQAVSDGFDRIGASFQVESGRETITIGCTVLPEFLTEAVDLIAEVIQTPVFPEEFVSVARELTRQEYLALADDAQGLTDKLLHERAYGPVLGRHPLGEPDEVAKITQAEIQSYWKAMANPARTACVLSGPVELDDARKMLESRFQGTGSQESAVILQPQFTAGRFHHQKDLEQEHIGIAFPGAAKGDADYPAQRIALGVLSGGMSSRLFTEVREKQGLVYWVSAWQDTPRGSGMIFVGASTTPERSDKTYDTLLSEVARMESDITQEELDRARIGMLAKLKTRGFSTRALCSELADDLFHHGRPVSHQEKIDRIQAVGIDDVVAFLKTHPRDELCVVTLGPGALHS